MLQIHYTTTCDACKELGSDLPVYELRGNGLRVHFKALQSALIEHSKAPKHQSDVLDDVFWKSK